MKNDNRYLVFMYDQYYPGGGMSDLKDSFMTINQVVEFCEKETYETLEVYDRIEGLEINMTKYGLKY